MRVVTSLTAAQRLPARAVVTVGVFDGVHVAHQRLIRSTVRLARRLPGASVVITFDPDPQTVLAAATAPPALMSVAARLRLFQSLGVAWTIVLPFSRRFARMSARQFIRRVLVGRLHASALIVGEAFMFGRDRLGDMALLRAIGPTAGMRVIAVKSICRGGAPVSSSRIRRLIHDGRLTPARHLLGRPVTLEGIVVGGAGRGRRLGFPTANLRLIPQALPPQGVYVVTVRVGAKAWGGVMNLGTRPTFGAGPVICEAHLFGFSGTLRGRSVSVSVLARLRGERCFSSPAALVQQVRRDIRRARRLLASAAPRVTPPLHPRI